MESSEKEVYECIFMHKDPTSIGEAILESKPPNYQPHLKVLIKWDRETEEARPSSQHSAIPSLDE